MSIDGRPIRLDSHDSTTWEEGALVRPYRMSQSRKSSSAVSHLLHSERVTYTYPKGERSREAQERRYLKNVTRAALIWYGVSFRQLAGAASPPLRRPCFATKGTLQQFVMALRDRGIRPGHLQHLHRRDERVLPVAA